MIHNGLQEISSRTLDALKSGSQNRDPIIVIAIIRISNLGRSPRRDTGEFLRIKARSSLDQTQFIINCKFDSSRHG